MLLGPKWVDLSLRQDKTAAPFAVTALRLLLYSEDELSQSDQRFRNAMTPHMLVLPENNLRPSIISRPNTLYDHCKDRRTV